jgi:apolipoprotein N-acyltransferase
LAIEVLSLLASRLPPARAAALRNAALWLSRAAYYAGVPAWLVLRLMSG